MTRMTKAMYLNMTGENIVWDYKVGKNQGRIFFLEINGQKFKRTPADQKVANKIIDEMFANKIIDDMFPDFDSNRH